MVCLSLSENHNQCELVIGKKNNVGKIDLSIDLSYEQFENIKIAVESKMAEFFYAEQFDDAEVFSQLLDYILEY
jgi:hypothetical protein